MYIVEQMRDVVGQVGDLGGQMGYLGGQGVNKVGSCIL